MQRAALSVVLALAVIGLASVVGCSNSPVTAPGIEEVSPARGAGPNELSPESGMPNFRRHSIFDCEEFLCPMHGGGNSDELPEFIDAGTGGFVMPDGTIVL